MFAKSIVLSDAFLDMPLSARCLYFTLGMLADDDGFVGSPKSIMRQCGASQDDMAILLQKRYVLGFDSGVIVIKHWRMNNYLQNDRKKETTYIEEKNQLVIDQKGAYTEKPKNSDKLIICENSDPVNDSMYTECIQNVYTDKNSIDKNSKDYKERDKKESRNFVPPTLSEVKAYCQERNNGINPEQFIDFYESKGWFVGKNKMKDWKAAVRNWEQRRKEERGENDRVQETEWDPSKHKFFDLP